MRKKSKRSSGAGPPLLNHADAEGDAATTADQFLTVGIGASAGGLQAFTSFLEALPSDTGMAFVLVQHLDPAHRSLLVELLAKQTAMPVVEATDGMMLAPDTVFVIPPDATMTLLDGALVVSRPAPPRAARHPIDSCFISLARDRRRYAVAIVLAGLGGDGSLGLAEIKQHGGLVLAQAGEDGRALAGMPHSAVATGLVDQLLAVDAMPARLLAYQAALRRGPAEAGEGGDAGSSPNCAPCCATAPVTISASTSRRPSSAGSNAACRPSASPRLPACSICCGAIHANSTGCSTTC